MVAVQSVGAVNGVRAVGSELLIPFASIEGSPAVTLEDVSYEIAVLRCDQLNIDKGIDDGSYQRRLSKKKLRELKPFIPDLCGEIAVNLRKPEDGGGYWVMDGQHRLEAARRAGRERINCRLFRGWSRAQEALFWYTWGDTQDSPSTIEKFRARVAFGNPAACDIARVLGQYDFYVEESSFSTKPGGVSAVAKLDQIYEAGGAERLDQVIWVIARAWPKQSQAANQQTLMALAALFGRYGNRINKERLVGVLRPEDPNTLVHAAQGRAGKRVPAWKELVTLMREMYNKRLAKNNRLAD